MSGKTTYEYFVFRRLGYMFILVLFFKATYNMK
jgi:hypothetical protein